MVRRSLHTLGLFVLLSALLIPLANAADSLDGKKQPAKKQEIDYELFKVFVDTLDQVDRNYVKDVDRRKLIEAAIRGMLSELDPYSNYINPKQLTGFQERIESKFGGVGIRITTKGGPLMIISPLVGSPAYRAGVQAGDRIVKINGESTKGFRIDEAVRRLKGKEGTSVEMTIIHAGETKQHTVKLTREVIQLQTVMGDTRKDDDSWDFMLDHERKIGYIRLTSFGRRTSNDMRKALNELAQQNVQGLVLDLRFNPGGLLSSAIEICDMFISEGRIVSTAGRNSRERKWDAHKKGTFEGFPMAVLVNRYSASASEIVAACLQDHKRAIVVGGRSFGKGSVQNVIRLEGGKSALKLTTAGYMRPSGKNIHRFSGAKDSDEWGVTPSEGFALRLDDADMALLSRIRRERDIVPARKKAEEPLPANPDPEAPLPKNPDPKVKETPLPDNPDPKVKGQQQSKGDTRRLIVVRVAFADDTGAKAEKTKGGAKKDAKFVDRQLQKALEYLTAEIARAK